MKLADLTTPALVVDRALLDANLATMAAVLPGTRLRPHVKAFKTTALARRMAALGHTAFTCATIREVEGMAAAGLGDDLLLANEVLDCRRLGAITDARVTVADRGECARSSSTSTWGCPAAASTRKGRARWRRTRGPAGSSCAASWGTRGT